MTTFVWYSKGSKETGELIAGLINADGHGTVPPKNFSGIAIGFGAKPSDKFKWETRNIRAILNDPRVVREFLDRGRLFDRITELGIDTVAHQYLEGGDVYAEVCQEMAIEPGEGFIACLRTGARARIVRTQAALNQALADGCTLATETRFGAQNRIRFFVVNGQVVASLRKTTEVAADQLAQNLAGEVEGVAANAVNAVLEQLAGKGLIKANKSFWAPAVPGGGPKTTTAQTIARELNFGFCAVDISTEDTTVYNVVATPALVGHTSAHAPIRDALNTWVRANDKSARELLQEMVGGANDEECEALLEGLRELKRQA